MRPMYHYTIYPCLPSIWKDRALKPGASTGGLLWFSTADPWEPMAGKCLDARYGWRRLTFKQQSKQLGCVRFAVDRASRSMLDWSGINARAGFTAHIRDELEKEAQEIGADPRQWFATPEAIPVDGLRFEYWNNDRWNLGQLQYMAERLRSILG